MLRYIYGDDLNKLPKLRDSMFRDRATQFHDRLNWDVNVDAAGFEIDQYDHLNPIYVIWEQPDGSHGGSMRMLPTTGDTMLNDHFADIAGAEIRHPLIWECTRFCLSENAPARVSPAMLLAVFEVGRNFHLTDVAGVFDARMTRIYRRIGWEPTILGTSGLGRQAISVGLWEIGRDVRARLLAKAGLSSEVSCQWFNRSFGISSQLELAQTA